MKKRISSVLIVILLLIQVFSVVAFADTRYSGNTYYQDPYFYLSKIISTDEEVIIPSELEDHIVYSIGDDEIKFCVMEYDQTRSITIPDTVKIIGNYAFGDCSSIRYVDLSSNLEFIGYGAFTGTKISSVTLPSTLKTIGKYAFSETALQSITIPDNVTNFADGATPQEGVFYKCLSLKEADLGSGITRLGNYAFANCSSLDTVDFGDSVETIGTGAFYGCTSLSDISLPDSLYTLQTGAFMNCNALNSVELPANLDTVYAPAFVGCNSLEEITVNKYNTEFTSIDGVLFTSDKLTLVEYPAGKGTDYKTPVGTVVIDDGAFYGNALIENVYLTKGAERIGEDTFSYCTNLESIAIPSTVTSIDDTAFDGCTSLSTIYFGGTETQWQRFAHIFDSNVDIVFVKEPAYTKKPSDIYVVYGQDASFEVKATGSYLKYQWYIADENGDIALSDNDKYSGTKKSKLVIDGFDHTCERSGDDRYYCVISNMFDDVKSNTVRVYVTHKDEDGKWSVTGTEHWHKCYCDEEFDSDIHDGTWKVIEKATMTEEGLEKKYCKKCNYEMDSREIPRIKVSTADVFDDIKKTNWFFKNGAIDYVYNNGLFKGISATRFEPNTSMTRGMFVTVLGRLHGIDTSTIADKTKFDDVKPNAYYTKYVNWASAAGIVNGVSSSSFAPNANVTREQICKMMVEYCNYAEVELANKNEAINFADSDKISNYAKDYVKICQRAGLVNGVLQDGVYYFKPKGKATRAEVATILLNFYNNYLV